MKQYRYARQLQNSSDFFADSSCAIVLWGNVLAFLLFFCENRKSIGRKLGYKKNPG